jgi:hypothetical protein
MTVKSTWPARATAVATASVLSAAILIGTYGPPWSANGPGREGRSVAIAPLDPATRPNPMCRGPFC